MAAQTVSGRLVGKEQGFFRMEQLHHVKTRVKDFNADWVLIFTIMRIQIPVRILLVRNKGFFCLE